MTFSIGCYSHSTIFAWGGGPQYATENDAAEALRKEDLSRFVGESAHMGRCVMTIKRVRKKDKDGRLREPEDVPVIVATDRQLGLRK